MSERSIPAKQVRVRRVYDAPAPDEDEANGERIRIDRL